MIGRRSLLPLVRQRPQALRSLVGHSRRDEDKDDAAAAASGAAAAQHRGLHATSRVDNVTPLVVGTSVAAIAYSGKLVLDFINKRENARLKREAEAATGAKDGEAAGAEGAGAEESPSWFSNFSFSLGKRFYEGGFEEEMTRREAALVLGIRESATREKVREAHRRLALLNHPDTGGSTYVAAKINEAKDKLTGN